MADVNVDKIVVKLSSTEAIDVGWAIKDELIKSVADGYDTNSNYSDLYQLCKQLLTVAYGYDYGNNLDAELSKAKPAEDNPRGLTKEEI